MQSHNNWAQQPQQNDINDPKLMHDKPPPKVNQHQPQQNQPAQNSVKGSQLSTNGTDQSNNGQSHQLSWWKKLTKKQKCCLWVVASFVVFCLIGLALFLYFFVFKFSLRLDYNKAQKFIKNNSTQEITNTQLSIQLKKLIGPYKEFEGQVTTFTAGKQRSRKSGFPVLRDKSVISLKYLNRANQILQIDTSQVFKRYSQKRPVDAKRLLALMTLQRSLEDSTPEYKQFLKTLKNTFRKDQQIFIMESYQRKIYSTSKGYKIKQQSSIFQPFAHNQLFWRILGELLDDSLIDLLEGCSYIYDQMAINVSRIEKDFSAISINIRKWGNTITENGNSYFSTHSKPNIRLLATQPTDQQSKPTDNKEEASQGLNGAAIGCTNIDESTKRCPQPYVGFYTQDYFPGNGEDGDGKGQRILIIGPASFLATQ